MANDHLHLLNLMHLYAEAVDAADFNGLGRMFADGEVHLIAAHLGAPQRHKGRDAVRDFYSSRIFLHDGSPRTKHVITNQIISFSESGDAAQARSYFHVMQDAPDVPLQIIISGRYHDVFTRTPDGWRFQEKRIIADFVGDIRRHSRPSR